MTLHVVIMAGGAGTRFWPASRRSRPKQFLPLARGRPLLQDTIDRVRDVSGTEKTWIVTNPEQATSLPQVLEGFPEDHVIVEPEARDTAPCVALATATIEAREPGATIAVMPADHVIESGDTLVQLLRRAASLAEAHDALVTFGLVPALAATGFGYIEAGEAVDTESADAHRVARFVEKPDRATAEALVRSGALWNSGIFVWNYAALASAMGASNPLLLECMEAMLAAIRSGDTPAFRASFRRAPRTSVDFAIMEKARNVIVVRADLSWSDLGSFLALDKVGETDPAGNVAFTAAGAGTFLLDSSGCVIYGEGKRTITLFGTRDLVVVAVDDAVLVCPKERAEDIKTLVEALRSAGHDQIL